MNAALVILALAGCAVALIVIGLKMARGGGRTEGELRAEKKAFQKGVEKLAKAQQASARPLSRDPGVVADRLAQRRKRQLRDVQAARGDGSSDSTPSGRELGRRG